MQVIAHRGAAAVEPENTIDAFVAAIDARADAIELDVRLSADGVPVVIHDDDVARMTGATGAISEMSMDEIERLPVGTTRAGPPGRIPRLADVLDAVGGRIRLIVELKLVPAGHTVSALPVLEAAAPLLTGVPDLVVDSFDPVALSAARDRIPDAPSALACLRIPGDDWMITYAAEHGFEIVMAPYADADPAWVERLHDAGRSVYAWGARVADAGAARAAGLDGILVSDPAGARAALGG